MIVRCECYRGAIYKLTEKVNSVPQGLKSPGRKAQLSTGLKPALPFFANCSSWAR
jgi:hypothetical protein